MLDVDHSRPDTLLEAIPDPDTVRDWLTRSIRRSALLRSLLRVAERKARYREGTASKGEAHHAA
jgi:hypothetical protein